MGQDKGLRHGEAGLSSSSSTWSARPRPCRTARTAPSATASSSSPTGRPSSPRPPAARSRCSGPSSPSTTWASRARITPAAGCSCRAGTPRPRAPDGPGPHKETFAGWSGCPIGVDADRCRVTPRPPRGVSPASRAPVPPGVLTAGARTTDADDRAGPREVIEVAGLPPTATAFDVGAGTGKLTRLLMTAFTHVVAVEPAEAMRGELVARCPTADVRNATGQELPLPDASVDTAFAAEAFYWFYDDQALAQMARVLRPRKRGVLMWNVPAGPCDPSIASVERLLLDRLRHADVGSDPLDLGGLHTRSPGLARLVLCGTGSNPSEHTPAESADSRPGRRRPGSESGAAP